MAWDIEGPYIPYAPAEASSPPPPTHIYSEPPLVMLDGSAAASLQKAFSNAELSEEEFLHIQAVQAKLAELDNEAEKLKAV